MTIPLKYQQIIKSGSIDEALVKCKEDIAEFKNSDLKITVGDPLPNIFYIKQNLIDHERLYPFIPNQCVTCGYLFNFLTYRKKQKL